MTLKRVPRVLVLHLSRFSHDASGAETTTTSTLVFSCTYWINIYGNAACVDPPCPANGAKRHQCSSLAPLSEGLCCSFWQRCENWSPHSSSIPGAEGCRPLDHAGSRKDGRSVRFPLELQLSRDWMSDQSDHARGATLDLIATVAHHGKTMQSGHYTVRFVPEATAVECLFCSGSGVYRRLVVQILHRIKRRIRRTLQSVGSIRRLKGALWFASQLAIWSAAGASRCCAALKLVVLCWQQTRLS